MKRRTKAGALFDRILNLLLFPAGAILVFILLSITAEVIMRYFFNRPITWVVEISEYSLLYITFLGAAWVLREEGHAKVDAVLWRLPQKARAFVNMVTSVAGTLICMVLLWQGALMTWENFQSGYLTQTILEVPKYLILAIVPVGSFLLVIQFSRRALGFLKIYKTV